MDTIDFSARYTPYHLFPDHLFHLSIDHEYLLFLYADLLLRNLVAHVWVGGWLLPDDILNTDHCIQDSFWELAISSLHSSNVRRKDNSNDIHLLPESPFYYSSLNISNNPCLNVSGLFSFCLCHLFNRILTIGHLCASRSLEVLGQWYRLFCRSRFLLISWYSADDICLSESTTLFSLALSEVSTLNVHLGKEDATIFVGKWWPSIPIPPLVFSSLILPLLMACWIISLMTLQSLVL